MFCTHTARPNKSGCFAARTKTGKWPRRSPAMAARHPGMKKVRYAEHFADSLHSLCSCIISCCQVTGNSGPASPAGHPAARSSARPGKRQMFQICTAAMASARLVRKAASFALFLLNIRLLNERKTAATTAAINARPGCTCPTCCQASAHTPPGNNYTPLITAVCIIGRPAPGVKKIVAAKPHRGDYLR